MSDEIGIAMRALMQRLQPGQIILSVAGNDRVLACKGWIANDRIEAAVLAFSPRREKAGSNACCTIGPVSERGV
jgi:hypothetical protein